MYLLQETLHVSTNCLGSNLLAQVESFEPIVHYTLQSLKSQTFLKCTVLSNS